MNLAFLNDQLLPQNFTDGFAPNFDFSPTKARVNPSPTNSPNPQNAAPYASRGSTIPAAASVACPFRHVLYRDAGNNWQPVVKASEYAIRKRDPIRVIFEP